MSALAPWLVRSARPRVPQQVLDAALAGGDGSYEQAPATVSDTAVVMTRAPGGRAATLKLAVTGPGMAALERERDILSRLGGDEGLGDWRRLLPVPLRWGEAGGGAFLLTTRLSGGDARHAGVAEAGQLTAAAVSAITPLHAHQRTVTAMDDAMTRAWVSEPAERLRRAVRSPAAVDRVAGLIQAGLAGAGLAMGWTHGDFHPGNVLTIGGTRTGTYPATSMRVTGVVDWDQAVWPGPVAVDLAFWLLTVPSEERGELGARVAARLRRERPWTNAEQRLLDSACGDDPAVGRAVLLLAWLRHVAGNLAKSDRYARSPLWARRNVRPVLRQAARG